MLYISLQELYGIKFEEYGEKLTLQLMQGTCKNLTFLHKIRQLQNTQEMLQVVWLLIDYFCSVHSPTKQQFATGKHKNVIIWSRLKLYIDSVYLGSESCLTFLLITQIRNLRCLMNTENKFFVASFYLFS